MISILIGICVFAVFIHYHITHWSNKNKTSKRSLYPIKKTKKCIDIEETSICQLDLDKRLYHQLQNLEYYSDALLPAYNRLLSLFDSVIDAARTSSTRNILNAVQTFSKQALIDFLNAEYTDVNERYNAYLARRKNGGSREMFPDFDYARHWLRTSAPVKYVDGAWLGGIHRVTTDSAHRPYTKTLWQILSEELGDGDLQKNHVWIYRELLQSIGVDDIGTGDSEEFVSSIRNVNNDARVWTAAIAQLCISLFPETFLPEILGFNMSYECLPLHLLITIHELRELNIDPYYFVLHVSIDNNHSGHAAMGMDAVVAYITSLPAEDQNKAWKRVQTGFLLASELPTTPRPRSQLDTALAQVFEEKTHTAKSLHLSCPARIGGRVGKKLSEWLDPISYPVHSLAFLRALADSRWIVRGQPEKSRLVHEIKWNGRMFGAFTIGELAVLEAWIRELAPPTLLAERSKSYETFTGVQTTLPKIELASKFIDILDRPSAPRHQGTTFETVVFASMLSFENKHDALMGLLSVSAVPFEYLPSLPAKCASSYGMMAVKCLRALYGFLPESDACAGMHAVTSNTPTLGVKEIASISLSNMDMSVREFVTKVMHLSARPEQNESLLVGLQSGFIEYVFEACKQLGAISAKEMEKLDEIRVRCRHAIDHYTAERNEDKRWLADMIKGEQAVRTIISYIID
ncbi:unnamed protein product [Adineta ricciae]|uniref:Uncharacterized protein n=1 Tax=Adineta ricciae TaxID=249248 RepID=A0A815HPS5_ADIRI|nr:unnamed protein product [Adineta ricciae]CAF1357857.1 unnamed protein product [Adineta ricciae]